jgi:hypothetical protein
MADPFRNAGVTAGVSSIGRIYWLKICHVKTILAVRLGFLKPVDPKENCFPHALNLQDTLNLWR